MGNRGEGYVIIQILLLMLIAFGPESLPFIPSWGPIVQGILTPIAMILGICGLLLIGMAVVNLGANLTPFPHPKEDSTLIESGAYRFVRHPIYAGILFAALGWSLWKGSLPMVLYTVLLALFFDIKSRLEERWLIEKFESYSDYQKRVRKLIPFVY